MSEGYPFPKRTTRILVTLGLLGFAAAAFAALQLAASGEPRFHGTAYPDAPQAPAFALTDHTGGVASLEEYRGRTPLLFFGFTRCPDVCPRTLARLTRVLNDAGIPAEQVPILLVTVDPEYDSPERLAEYVAQFGGRVRGLSVAPDALEPLLADYGVFAQEAEGHDGHVSLAHTSLIFGIDAAGRLRVLMHADEPDEILLEDIRTLMRLRG